MAECDLIYFSVRQQYADEKGRRTTAESNVDTVNQQIQNLEIEEENARRADEMRRRQEESSYRPGREGWGMPPPPYTSWSEARLAESQ